MSGGADIAVLLGARELGGHEAALLGWLADALALGLRPVIAAATPALAAACAAQGLGRCVERPRAWPAAAGGGAVVAAALGWRRELPLLLAPGVLHADGALLAAAVLARRRTWVYVPMTHTAAAMGYRHAAWRDRSIAPWLRHVAGWITVDERQARQLRERWSVAAPVLTLPNLARVGAHPPAPRPAADGRQRVAYVGRFAVHQKGLDWLVATLRGDRRWTERFRWRFQGRGEGEPLLRRFVCEVGARHAELSGHAPIDDALAHSDIVLLPSRYEGVPLVALEATAHGWPVVASRASGLAALLPEGSLFDFGDGAALERALGSLAGPQARAAAVAHARARCGEQAAPYRSVLQRLVGTWRQR